jgi:hypothetical protein
MSKTWRLILVFLLVACLGPLGGSSAWAKTKDIQVIAADDFGLTLELTTPSFRVKEIKGADGVYQSLSIAGWAKTSVPGYPELPALGLMIQVPKSGELSVQVLAETHESLQNLNISPVPKLAYGKDPEVLKNDQVYQSSATFPGDLVQITARSMVHRLSVARVMFYPFQWNPLTKELTCSSTIRVRINFQDPLSQPAATAAPAEQAFGAQVFETLLKSNLPNYHQPAVTQAPTGTQLSLAQTTAPQDLCRVEVQQDGIYRLTYEALSKAKVKGNKIDPTTFQLFNRDTEVAIRVVSKTPNRFKSGDYLEFYGQGINNIYTGTNVYWLHWGQGSGKRMAVVPAEVTGQGTSLDTFWCSLHNEKNQTIWEDTPGAPTQDFWFWEILAAPDTRDYALNVPAPAMDGSDAVLRICFRGYTSAAPYPDHHTRVSINGSQIGDSQWSSDIEYIQEMHFSSSLLNAGSNTVTIEVPGDTGAALDMVYLNWIEVNYQRRFEAAANTLTFAVSGNGRTQVAIGSLSQPGVLIYDISDPSQVNILTGFQVAPGANGYQATFEDNLSGTKTYCAITPDLAGKPSALALWHPSNLKSTSQGADYILITPRDFLPSVKSLCSFRKSQGLRVSAVAVEDIYNEFSYGLFDPQAIKDFLNYAYRNWNAPAPTYVFLVGDANTDYRDYLGSGKKNQVPVHLTYTSGLGLTPDDNWYVAFGNDGLLPQMFIGRVPGANARAAKATLDKILTYEKASGYHFTNALFAADNGDPTFEQTSEALIGDLSSDYGALRIYLSAYSDISAATRDLINDINAGVLLTTYVGHGDVTDWTGDGLFDPSNLSALNNRKKLTFVMTLDCLNGYFSQPFMYSLGEEFVIASNKGAIASFVPSGLGYTWEHAILGSNIFNAIFQEHQAVLGAITTQSKINAYTQGTTPDLVKTFTLIGDPATRLKLGLGGK